MGDGRCDRRVVSGAVCVVGAKVKELGMSGEYKGVIG